MWSVCHRFEPRTAPRSLPRASRPERRATSLLLERPGCVYINGYPNGHVDRSIDVFAAIDLTLRALRPPAPLDYGQSLRHWIADQLVPGGFGAVSWPASWSM